MKALAEVVEGNSNETRAATDGIVPAADELSSLTPVEALMSRREQPLQTQSTVDSGQAQKIRVLGTAAAVSISAVVECAGAGAGVHEGVTASGVMGMTAIQADGDAAGCGWC